MPIVSVILPTFNRLKLLNEALESLSNQTFKDFEVIVINDGGEIPKKVIENWNNILDIKLINSNINNGPGIARNIGIEESQGDFLAFLDDDDIFLPSHLEYGVKFLVKSNLDFIYTNMIMSSKRIKYPPKFFTKEYRIIGYKFVKDFLMICCFFTLGTFICRNFKNTSIRFSNLFTVCEDWELQLKLCINEGFKGTNCKKITTIYHRVPEKNSLCTNATISFESNLKFVNAWRKIITNFSTNNLLIKEYRNYMIRFHNRCIEHLKNNKELNLFYYEDFVNFLYTSFISEKNFLAPDLDEQIDKIILKT
ncbi:MAG: glycosyltransferase family 2 protein [Brevinematia bacterium]